MKNLKLIVCVVSATFAAVSPAGAQTPRAGDAAPVRVENFIRAESWVGPRHGAEFRSELPKTATGKIQRFKLRAEAEKR